MLTDDPGTPSPGKWEINLAFTIEREGKERVFEAPLLDVNYGVGHRIQVKYEIPWVLLKEERGTEGGLGNSLFGLKWRFADQGQCGISASVYPQLELNNRASSARRGLVENGATLLLPIEVAGSIGLLEINGEFGYALQQDRDDELVWGLAVGCALSECFELLTEIRLTSSTSFDEVELLSNFGLRWTMTRALTLLASSGLGLDNGPDVFGYVGLQFSF